MNLANFLALCYSDIFNYPLTAGELDLWSISPKAVNFGIQKKEISISKYNNLNNYVFLPNKKDTVKRRETCKKYSQNKLNIAKNTVNYLKIISTIKMICVTGALSMDNSGVNDDIDLLLVVNKNRVWITRIMATFILILLGKRRKPYDEITKDKICLNMIIDETSLRVSDHNLYVAHEILQAKPLLNIDHTYEKFIHLNDWTKLFLPKAFRTIGKKIDVKYTAKIVKPNILSYIFDMADNLLFKIQYQYMKPKITRETVEKTRVLFHPRDTTKMVMQEFNNRIKKYLV